MIAEHHNLNGLHNQKIYNTHGTQVFAKEKEEKDNLISLISGASDDGDLLLDFMNLYGLDNLRDATVYQLKEYIRNNHLEEGESVGKRKAI